MFGAQRRQALAIVDAAARDAGLVTKADQGTPEGGGWPFSGIDWHPFRLGTKKESERFVPYLKALWDDGGRNFMMEIGHDPDEWRVTDPNVREAIDRAAFDFCDATNATTTQALNQALENLHAEFRDGMIGRGETLDQLRARVGAIFDQADDYRAQRIASSEASRAVHAAELMSAQQSGVVAGFEWLLSDDACALCREVGEKVKRVRLGDDFAVIGDHPTYANVKHPPLHPQCCLPETPVIAPVRIAGIEAQYDGPVVRLVLSDGSDVTVTPNHMLLTREGFAQASALAEGDDVIRCVPGDWMTLDIPEDDRKPIPIHQVVEALAVSPGMTARRMPVAPEDLHGDAEFCQGEVHVVTTHGQFTDDPSLAEPSDQPGSLDHERGKFGLCRRHRAWVGLIEKGDLGTVFVALLRATDGGMGRLRERKALALGRRRVSKSLGLAVGTGSDPQSEESPADVGTGDAERLRECLLRFPGKVATAKIVEIERLHYRGPVYDIETLTSLYLIGGGIVSSNCQCSVTEILTPEYGGPKDVRWGEPLVQPKPDAEAKPKPGPQPAAPSLPPRGEPILPDRPITERLAAYTEGDAKVAALTAIEDAENALKDRWRHIEGEMNRRIMEAETSGRQGWYKEPEMESLVKEVENAYDAWKAAVGKRRDRVADVLKAKNPCTWTSTVLKGAGPAIRKEIQAGEGFVAKMLEATPGKGDITITYETHRGAYRANAGQSTVRLSGKDDAHTVAHEIGHCLEDQLARGNRIGEIEKAFIAHRAKGEQPKKFRDLFPKNRYDANEEGVEDEFGRFFSPAGSDNAFGESSARYVGKSYPRRSELLSMGLEALSKNAVLFARRDPELCKMILGLLDGRLR